jgi:isopenicillin N synthase-like dioxygenase
MQHVPIIDVAAFRAGDPAARRGVARRVGEAVDAIGFLVIPGTASTRR